MPDSLPSDTVSAEITVKKSRFIAYLCKCSNADELKELKSILKKENRKARHIVSAAVFGKDGNTFSCSDDGEPRGTAGRPCLEVLKGKGMTDTAVFVIRYFGGVLLGTGGLSRAYSDSVKAVAEKASLVNRTEI